jgi:3D (Asp-Asp-Asp) domain-containing protein
MGHVPLKSVFKLRGLEKYVPLLFLAASLIGAGFVFFGDLASSSRPVRQVTYETDGLSNVYFTQARTVGDFLEEIGIEFSASDQVVPSANCPIRPGLVVSFARAKRIYLADAGQSEQVVMCPGVTVCDLLSQCGIETGPNDRIVPHPATPLQQDMHVEITRVEVLDITSERQIEPELTIEPDPDLPRGRMVEESPGTPGRAEDVTRYFYRNGEQTARIDLGSRVLVEPQNRTARVGVRSLPPLVSRGGVHRDCMVMVATAYDPGPISCGAYADGYTATGHVATRGVCAVDPRVIPLGTELWVEGYGYALACDTGGAIKGNRIDVCFDTYNEALHWGRRTVAVYILE